MPPVNERSQTSVGTRRCTERANTNGRSKGLSGCAHRGSGYNRTLDQPRGWSTVNRRDHTLRIASPHSGAPRHDATPRRFGPISPLDSCDERGRSNPLPLSRGRATEPRGPPLAAAARCQSNGPPGNWPKGSSRHPAQSESETAAIPEGMMAARYNLAASL